MSKYKIIADSSCELPKKLINDERFELIPFRLDIDGLPIRDTKDIDIPDLLQKIAASKECPKSACPSPDSFIKAFESDVEHIYVITISSKLSGSYNSACLAKTMYEEDNPKSNKKIIVIDSLSASGGETQLALRAMELEEECKNFDQIATELLRFRDTMITYFVLDNLETLRKNGRLTRMKALLATSLRIKPVLRADEGEIIQIGQSVGLKKAWSSMVDQMSKVINSGEQRKRIIISHCNNRAGALKVKELLEEKTSISSILVIPTNGLSSLYANDGGIIVTY